ncbi:MAG: serine/threonine-protein kinase [Planctomycetota bacterium]|nr:serine/threonine-protein kinase [Planctomycetota bacterium]
MTRNSVTRNQQLLINRLCNELEAGWRSGRPEQRPTIASLIGDVVDADRKVVLQELIALEIDCRRAQGDTPASEDYAAWLAEIDHATLLPLFAMDETKTELKGFSSPTLNSGTVVAHDVSVDDFVDRLRRSGLLDGGDAVDAADAVDGDAASATDCGSLADELVAAGRITLYQSEVLRTGANEPLALGDYTVVDRIGAGGMGVVYRAVHRRMKRTVALKVLHPIVANDPLRLKRFQREAETAARLSHPNIVTAHDAGEFDSVHYLITEFVEGEDLAQVVRRSGPLAFADAVNITIQASRGLEYAHQQGVIHRDIKPSNLLLDPNGTVKILDMGLARFDDQSAGPASTELTTESMIMGTVDYMSPEQALNTKTADERADVYSLGCTLFFLLTGRGVYSGATAYEKLVAHREHPIPDFAKQGVGVPVGFQPLFERMVAKKPEDRFQTMSDVADALSKPFGDVPVIDRASHHESAVASTGDSQISLAMSATKSYGESPAPTESIADDDQKAKRRSLRPLWIAGAGLLGLLAIVVIALYPPDPKPDPIRFPSGLETTGDEFNSASIADGWTVVERAPPGTFKAPRRLIERFDINKSRAGHLTVLPAQAAWYGNGTGAMIFREWKGNFILSTYVTVRHRDRPDETPDDQLQLAGLIARDSRSRLDNENWIVVQLGRVGVGEELAVKSESTRDSKSKWEQHLTSVNEGELRLCRFGNNFYAFWRGKEETKFTPLLLALQLTRPTTEHKREDMHETLQIGLSCSAGGLDQNNPQVLAEFEYVRVAVPKTQDDFTKPIGPIEP